MKIALAVILFILGFIFAMNLLSTLIGRYGPANAVRNALLAGAVATAAIYGGIALIM